MELLKVLILLALPASGKSEVRKFLRFLNAKICLRDFGLGHVIELDDYPYVHMMRLIDQVLIRADRKPTFFEAPDRPFIDAGNWLALIEFLNEDFKCLGTNWRSQTDSKARELLGRLAPLLLVSSRDPTATLKRQLETDAAKVVSALEVECAKDTEGATVVMEFARGGPLNASMPLPFPLGYRHSLATLSWEILRKASILYVDVDPAQARQKNRDRMPPPDFKGDTGIFHFVPRVVMDNDYGCDDIHYLLSASDRPNTVRIDVGGATYYLPCALFNNRDRDLTSFARKPEAEWTPAETDALHTELKRAFNTLAAAQANR